MSRYMWDKKKSKKTKHKKTKTNNSNILCNEHRAEFPLTVFSAIIQTRLYLLHSNVDIYLDKCTRVKSFSYMENRQTEENILSEYQKYSLTKKNTRYYARNQCLFLLSILNESISFVQMNTIQNCFYSNPCMSALSG